MLSSTETILPPTKAGLYFDPPTFDSSSSTIVSTGQRSLKRHKILPHPRNSKPSVAAIPRPFHGLDVDTSIPSSDSGSRPSSPPSLKRQPPSLRGPDLPPTPPAHSRNSSGSHSVLPSSQILVGSPVRSVSSPVRTPGTPPNQRSPPTPDVTPPRQARRPKAFRPLLADRIPSKATTDSRTESFKTAREDPYSSDEDGKSTLRPRASSGRTSQSTVRQSSGSKPQKSLKNIGLGLGLESDDNLTPRTKQEFCAFDGEWGSGGGSSSEVEQEWDDNLDRNVMVRKRRPPTKSNREVERMDKVAEVVEDVKVTPTNATRALRYMPLHESSLRMHSSLKGSPDKAKRWSSAPTASEPLTNTDTRRFSGMSSKSGVSTVVEAILLDAPPQRHQTLRHVRKQTVLRDPGYNNSPPSSAANSNGLDETIRRYKPRSGLDGARSESYASSGTVNSLSSRKARREVWKNGGIPVVVIPDRRASMKPTGTPSLRSTSSRRSQRSNSLSSVPLSNKSKTKDMTPYFDRPSRRGRAMSMSESDGSLVGDQRTIDYPPMVPVRTSSLSAPTSRNNSRANSLAGSRTGSLTADSLKALNASQEQQMKKQPPKVIVERAPSVPDVEYIAAEEDHLDQRQLQPAPSIESHRDAHDHRSLVDHNGDPFFGKRLTTHNTPFSQASVDTNGTHSAAEVSEAMAVNIYPHLNRSVLIVNHTSKSFDANALQRQQSVGTDETEKPVPVIRPSITATGPDGEPVTPPQTLFSMDDVDSPLRNPRAPPDPPLAPAIKFTPATPSGSTPAAEKMKMLGNYFETTTETEGRPSLVKRAFSLRKSSDNRTPRKPGFLSRTLSLSRNIRKETAENPELEKTNDASLHQYPIFDDPPPDEARLHPFWRPSSSYFDPENDEDWVRDIPGEAEQVYRHRAAGSRPLPPRRSLSSRMKRTFAILPMNSDEHYSAPDSRAPERRTIKRTPSGNLRVMRYHDSYSSLRWDARPSSPSHRHHSDNEGGRPSTGPGRLGRPVWGIEKRVDARGRRFFPGWQDKIEQFGLPNLQRRLSEHRRQKRSEALRQKISGPREVRDGVGEVIKRNSYKGQSYQAPSGFAVTGNNEQTQVEGVERAPKVQVQV
ncbi:hypothetical protein BJ170DRAFT_679084 [Xylariales sp. AK1849]|nr:hypothetical protein BJ170DRAFT_679084 [Xylariales sp. AK1849]